MAAGSPTLLFELPASSIEYVSQRWRRLHVLRGPPKSRRLRHVASLNQQLFCGGTRLGGDAQTAQHAGDFFLLLFG